MRVKQIINAVNTYYDYQNKISKCVIERNELIGWEDEYGIREMNKKINSLKQDLGKFLDSEV